MVILEDSWRVLQKYQRIGNWYKGEHFLWKYLKILKNVLNDLKFLFLFYNVSCKKNCQINEVGYLSRNIEFTLMLNVKQQNSLKIQ